MFVVCCCVVALGVVNFIVNSVGYLFGFCVLWFGSVLLL